MSIEFLEYAPGAPEVRSAVLLLIHFESLLQKTSLPQTTPPL